jgi:hypothetical protein
MSSKIIAMIESGTTSSKDKEKLTIEKFRTYPGCEEYSDEEALSAIQTVEKLAIILFNSTCHKNGIAIDNQLVIPLTKPEDRQNKAA